MAKFYQVGGSVRDELLGLPSKDIDYAVEAESFDAMRQAIVERGGEIFLETPAYFTIRGKVPGLGACDFVLCRKDGEYTDGRRPDSVEPGTIYDDLARRDFTVNAMAKSESGELLDPHNGRHSISVKRIKCVGSAKDRFAEDGLRVLRAIRLAITKEFYLDHEIDHFLSMNGAEEYLKGVSVERIREELHKCFVFDTEGTLAYLNLYPELSGYLFDEKSKLGLWLKPTLEAR